MSYDETCVKWVVQMHVQVFDISKVSYGAGWSLLNPWSVSERVTLGGRKMMVMSRQHERDLNS
jgi:hypothetical protein